MVKNWAVTTGGAVLALSVTARRPALAVIGCAVVLIFAYVETLYMFFQDHVVARSNRVERLLDATARADDPPDYRFGVSHAFAGSITARGVVGALRGRPHIYVFYLTLL